MLSFVYITYRAVIDPEFGINQYQLLSESLQAQTLQEFEVVVVDRWNRLPRPELAWLGARASYVRPRLTPWQLLGAFDPNTARNTGIRHALGETIVGLDDFVSFLPDLVQLVTMYAGQGFYMVPRCGSEFKPACYASKTLQDKAGGILAYPRGAALAAGGYDERYAGGATMEDLEFAERISRAGVQLAAVPKIQVKLNPHTKAEKRVLRCAHLLNRLIRSSPTNQPWTPEQLQILSGPCPYLQPENRCQQTCHTCDQPIANEVAVAVAQTYEAHPWLKPDLTPVDDAYDFHILSGVGQQNRILQAG